MKRLVLALVLAAVAAVALATRFDFSSDSRPDILFRNADNGATYLWRMNGLVLQGDALITTIDPSWQLIGHGDFDGDGKNDIVWRNNTSGTAYVWYLMDGAFVADAFLFTIDPIWKIEAVADFNNDGHPDFLFRHSTSGLGFVWYFNNTTPGADQFLYSIDNEWIVENVGDFNDDGYPDFFFRNTSSGLGFVWYWNGSSLGASNFLFSIDPLWQVVQIVDWNNDGKVDLLFRNDATGVTFVWYTDGTSLQGSDFLFQIDPAWKIVPREIAAAAPATAPAAPTGVSALRGNQSATVSWTTGADNGSAITGATIHVSGGATVGSSCTSGPCSQVVSGLVNGTSYTFQVSNTNAGGTSPLSASSNAVTPAGAPLAPTGVGATSGNAFSTVTWTTGSANGSAITGATIYAYPSSSSSSCVTGAATPSSSTCTSGACGKSVTGLTNGQAYCFRVSNSNAVGEGALSSLAGPVVPATVPGVPAVTFSTGAASAIATITAPASNGGKPIDSYRIDACSSGSTCGGAGICTGGTLAGFTTTSTTTGTVSNIPTCNYNQTTGAATCTRTYTMCTYAHNVVGYGSGHSAASVQPKVSFYGDNVDGIFVRHGCGSCHVATGSSYHNYQATPPTNYTAAVNEGTLIYQCPESGTGCAAMAFPYWTSSSGAGQTLRRWITDGSRQ